MMYIILFYLYLRSLIYPVWGSLSFFFFFLINLFYLLFFLAVLGLHCSTRAFSSWWCVGAALRCGAQASHCGGFSCCGAQALGA